MRILLSTALILMTFASYAQLSRKEKKAAKKGTPVTQPTSLDPASSPALPEVKESRKETRKKTKSKGPTYNNEKEFYDRMDARAKTYRKNEKNMETPQYTNPAYFGHKRPPKKRPANKMKYCKVCGIRH